MSEHTPEPVNHEEAAQLAAYHAELNDIARCYLDLHEQLAAIKSRHLTDAECDELTRSLFECGNESEREIIRQWFAGVMKK